MITKTGSSIIVDDSLLECNVSILSDTTIVADATLDKTYENRKIHIKFFNNGQLVTILYFSIVSVDYINKIFTLNKKISTNTYNSAQCNVYYNFDDITDEISDIFYVEKRVENYFLFSKSLIINGLVGSNRQLCFDGCNIKINDGGTLFMGDNTYENSKGVPVKIPSTRLKFMGSGSAYAKDNYRTNGTSFVNDGGTLILYGYDVIQDHTSRSDLDFRENSTIKLVEVSIQGTATSYHHFDSANMYLDRLKVYDAYSLEMMRTPVFCSGLYSVGCNYGLSIFPAETGRRDLVYIYDIESISSVYSFKRNRGNLILVDPTLDYANMQTTGSSKILFGVTNSNKFVDADSNPINNMNVEYFGTETAISSISQIDASTMMLTLGVDSDFLVTHGKTKIYVYSSEDISTGYIFDIYAEYSNKLEISSSNENLLSLASPVFRSYETLATNSDGEIINVMLPHGSLSSTYVKNNGCMYRLYYNGEIYYKKFNSLNKSYQVEMITKQDMVLVDDTVLNYIKTIIEPKIDKIDTQSSKKVGKLKLANIRNKFNDILNTVTSIYSNISTTEVDGKISDVNAALDTSDMTSILEAIANLKLFIESDANVTADLSALDVEFEDLQTSIAESVPDLSELETKIDAIPTTDLSGLETKVDAIPTTDLSSLETKIDAIPVTVSGLETKIDAIPVTDLSGLSAKIDAIDLSSLETKIDAIPTTDLSGLETKIDAIPTIDLSGLETKIDAIPTIDLSGLETKIDAIPTTDLSGLETKIDAIPTTDLSGLETKIDAIPTTDLTGLSAKIDAIPDLSSLETKIDGIPDLSALSTKIDNIPDLSGLETKIDAIPTTDLSGLSAKIDAIPVTDLSGLSAKIDAIPTTDLSGLETKIDAIPTTDLSGLSAKIDAIPTTDLSGLETKIDAIPTTDLSGLSAKIDAIPTTDLSGLETKIDAIPTTDLSGLSAKIDAIPTTDLSGLETKIDAIPTTDLSGLSAKIDAIPTTDLSGLETKIDAIPTTDLSGLSAKIDAIPTTVTDLETKIDAMPTTDLSGLETKIDAIPTTDLSGLETKIDAISAVDLSSLETKLDDMSTSIKKIPNKTIRKIKKSSELNLNDKIDSMSLLVQSMQSPNATVLNAINDLTQLVAAADTTDIESKIADILLILAALANNAETQSIIDAVDEFAILVAESSESVDVQMQEITAKLDDLSGLKEYISETSNISTLALSTKINDVKDDVGQIPVVDIDSTNAKIDTFVNFMTPALTTVSSELAGLMPNVSNILTNTAALDIKLDAANTSIDTANASIGQLSSVSGGVDEAELKAIVDDVAQIIDGNSVIDADDIRDKLANITTLVENSSTMITPVITNSSITNRYNIYVDENYDATALDALVTKTIFTQPA